MSPLEAITFIKAMSGKMSGLTLGEARHFDNSISVIEQFMQPTAPPKDPPKKLDLVKPSESKNPSH